MPRDRRKSKGRSDGTGGFGALPRHVWSHPDYQELSGSAVKLLMDFACQFNGRNNGDLTAAMSVLGPRGWKAKGTISRAVKELLAAGMVVKTRQGRFSNPGGVCDLYALAWKPIDECPGKNLEIGPTVTPWRKFSIEDIKLSSPQVGPRSVQKKDRQRARGEDGRYVSVHEQTRLRSVT